MTRFLRCVPPVLAAFALGLLAPTAGAVSAEEVQADTKVWDKVRVGLFGDRPIAEPAEAIVSVDAPARAEDASTVPIAIRTGVPQRADSYVRKIYLVIDNNPSPLGAVFTFTPESGRADLETRVRVENYTYVRAIAELSDGSLHMTKRFVRGSYGCSAPAGRDATDARSNLGRMRLKLVDTPVADKPVQAQLMVSHPNDSGLVMDQLSRLYEPSNFVRHIDVTYAGRLVMSADVDFTISQNPNFRFYFVPTGEGELKAEVVDSRDLRFESSLSVRDEKH